MGLGGLIFFVPRACLRGLGRWGLNMSGFGAEILHHADYTPRHKPSLANWIKPWVSLIVAGFPFEKVILASPPPFWGLQDPMGCVPKTPSQGILFCQWFLRTWPLLYLQDEVAPKHFLSYEVSHASCPEIRHMLKKESQT